MKYRISIIVPAYNEEKALPNCLDSLMALEFPKDKLQIIVVDNNSTDATKDIINAYPVRYAFEQKRGRACARNRGIKEAEAELVAFIDADCLANRFWLSNILKGFTSESVGGCGGKILSYYPKSWLERRCHYRGFCSQREGLIQQDLFLPRIATANAIYRYQVLQEVGLFDESFITNEDVDLSWRVFLKGYQLNYVPEAIVYHRTPTQIKRLFKASFEYGYARSFLIEKYIVLIKNPWLEFFSYQLRSVEGFSIARIIKNGVLNNLFLYLFDFIKNIEYFLGIVYGVMILKFKIKKSSYQPKPEKSIYWRVAEEGVVISDFEKKCRYVLNQIASRIWMLLKEGKDRDEIIALLANQYETNKEELRSDCITFIDELDKLQLKI